MYFGSLVLIGILSFANNIAGHKFEFSNAICETRDKTFLEFPYCHLKSHNRSYKYFSLKVKLYQLPITNASFSFAFKKKANGYKPFLYNFTVDACKFLKNQNQANAVVKYFYSFISNYSNMNHSCPYNHDLIVDKVDMGFEKNKFAKLLPWPDGEYAVFTSWFAYNRIVADVNIFFKTTNQ